jgi:hypothetical protein
MTSRWATKSVVGGWVAKPSVVAAAEYVGQLKDASSERCMAKGVVLARLAST